MVLITSCLRVEHEFECFEELSSINHSIAVIINRLDGFQGLRFSYYCIDVEAFKEVVEELSHFVNIQGSVFIGIVFVEDCLDVGLKHFIL